MIVRVKLDGSPKRVAAQVKSLVEGFSDLGIAVDYEIDAYLPKDSADRDRLLEDREEARSMCRSLRAELGAQKTWPFPWEDQA